ncbi:transmembrane amino acid transporter protein-domain-containing protein [Dimargaris cristalligena]|uniref:Transmembrane amino acid transporter protein-domain-containing protein n=1 Tax=Dimargaris cristalligena TaxID=215637 RepID=A0A4P9ZX00_9FUNG|nr:transmembrane amino acid transporter protein-domain-containing protein [Dimargaris cristalligena]|eukprot:RKP38194.1 transmembrane amino acid transporter protein-domain-containing protein [Dimargaris cristalligena]
MDTDNCSIDRPASFDAKTEGGHGHGHEERTGSSMGAFFNIVCVIAGTGTLQLPFAFGQAGWLGALCVILAGLFSLFTGHLLIKCLYYKEGQRLSNFPDVGLAAFGKVGKYVVLVLHYSICLGSACVYINIAGKSVFDLGKNINMPVPMPVWVIIAALLVYIPFVAVKSMKEVAILAIFGAVATLVMVIVVVIMGLIDMPNQIEPIHSVVNWSMVPVAMGSICFSYGGNVVYPHVESAMKNPQAFTKTLSLATFTIVAMYLTIGIVGYHVYGATVKTPIYDSLPKNAATTIAILLLVAHVILAAPIMLTTFALEVEEAYDITVARLGRKREFMMRAIIRTLTVVVLTIPAMFLPVGVLMSLVGSLSNSLIIFVLPIICYWRLYGIRSMNYGLIAFSVVCIVIALMACYFGTVDAIKDIVKLVQSVKAGKPMF